jgi:ABC-type transport system involved in cytochrome c biogenesis permease subunit
MRTLGETRLWYATFSPIIGLVTYLRYKYKWLLGYSAFISILFLGINASNPEVMNKTLMPALQSVWFVPHVLVYLFAYALLGTSALIALRGLTWGKNEKEDLVIVADNLVFTGFSFLTMGLLFGALWAKKAWGHYWTWDPKETWALITWMLYLIFIHLRYLHPRKTKIAFHTLLISFCILIACWYGVNYMPSSANSVHTYTKTS